MAKLSIDPNFRDFLRYLNNHGVVYLVIGGYAVMHHGYVRTTGDLDVWIATNPENAQRVAKAVQEFGFKEATPDLFSRFGKMTRMGEIPVRIEILTDISGVTFDACYVDRVIADVHGILVPIISRKHLIANKRASDRDKDRDDIKWLDRVLKAGKKRQK